MAREGRSEIERALTGRRPKLVADFDLHGILHGRIGTGTLEKAPQLETVCEHPEPSMPT